MSDMEELYKQRADLIREATELRTERDQLNDKVTSLGERITYLRDQLKRAERNNAKRNAELDRLREALRKYGDHAVANVERVDYVKVYDCAVADGKPCTCGYEAVLAGGEG